MKVIKKISTISGYASGVLIALIWALMIAEVIMRNIFLSSHSGLQRNLRLYVCFRFLLWLFLYADL